MANGSDLNVLRDRQAALDASADRAEEMPAPRAARRLVQVYDGGGMPTQANRVYLAHPVELDGEEIEGGQAAFNVDQSATVPVVVLHGPAQVGDVLTAHAVGGRWVAEIGQSQGPQTGIVCGACTVPRDLYVTDAYTTTIVKYVESLPSWALPAISGPWLCSGAWVGCYSLPNQLVASSCGSPPYPAPYNGSTPIRYVLGLCGNPCAIHAWRVWGTTNLVAAPPAITYADCEPTSDCGAVSAVCSNSDCNADWQADSYIGPLPSCDPFPLSIVLNLSTAPPGAPLSPTIIIDA